MHCFIELIDKSAEDFFSYNSLSSLLVKQLSDF